MIENNLVLKNLEIFSPKILHLKTIKMNETPCRTNFTFSFGSSDMRLTTLWKRTGPSQAAMSKAWKQQILTFDFVFDKHKKMFSVRQCGASLGKKLLKWFGSETKSYWNGSSEILRDTLRKGGQWSVTCFLYIHFKTLFLRILEAKTFVWKQV